VKDSRATQRSQLLTLFIANRGREVPLPDILALGIAQYNARIFELRHLGFRIKNRTQNSVSLPLFAEGDR